MTATLEGRRALVTGGAGGIGLATARVLRDRGAAVALIDSRAEFVGPAASAIGAVSLVADVRQAPQVATAVADASCEMGGPVDLLVNAAGIYRIAPFLEIAVDEWEEVLAVNLRGSWLVAREAARGLIAAGVPGSIINISSTAGLIADASELAAHYNASKAG